MELLLAITAGTLYAAGLYLLLRRRLAQLIVGLGLLTNGTNMRHDLPEDQAKRVLELADALEQDDDVQRVFHTLA